jgi:Ni,Fe-hydrogenase I cytochrome b subunit
VIPGDGLSAAFFFRGSLFSVSVGSLLTPFFLFRFWFYIFGDALTREVFTEQPTPEDYKG